MKKVCSHLILALLLGGVGLSSHSLAQAPLLDIRLGCEKTAYLLDPAPAPDGDPLTCVVTVENVSGREILARQGFAEHLHLLLRIGDPRGLQITAHHPSSGGSGPNLPVFIDAATNTFIVGEPVESVASDFLISVPFNVRDFYTLRTAGQHTAREFVPVRLYETTSLIPGTSFARFEENIFGGTLGSNAVSFTLIADADGDGYCVPLQYPILCPTRAEADCEDRPAGADGVLGSADDGANIHPGQAEIFNNGLDDDCNPNTPDAAPLVNPATLEVTATKHTIGSGQTPGAKKEPIANLHLRVFDRSPTSCVMQRFGVAQKYFTEIWTSCPNVVQGNTFTAAAGKATLQLPAGTHLLIGQYDPDGSTRGALPIVSGDEVYVGANVDLSPGILSQKQMQVLVRADASLTPAQSLTRTGSELVIIFPAYVEWDSSKELYPFILASIGDWKVTVSVTPPAGFVADAKSLTTQVNSTTRALQFTVTDVGSQWVDTEVTFLLEHKGKKEQVKSKIGVKLSKKLAQQKGFTEWGEPLRK